jgi:hypothetical protein
LDPLAGACGKSEAETLTDAAGGRLGFEERFRFLVRDRHQWLDHIMPKRSSLPTRLPQFSRGFCDFSTFA